MVYEVLVVVAAATAQYGLGMYENYVAKRAAEQPAAAKTETSDENKEKPSAANTDPTDTSTMDSPLLLHQHGFQKQFMMGDLKTKCLKERQH